MYYNRHYTGTIVAPIAKNQVFVFNSYSNGYNKAGTAKAALTYFGAKPGIGEGPCGQSYAIPSEVSLPEMRDAVNRFLAYAVAHPEQEFLVTPIGTGKIFKRDPKQMAKLFEKAVFIDNIILPKEVVNNIPGCCDYQSCNKIEDVSSVNYKIIRHLDSEFNESAIIKQVSGKYTIVALDLDMGGSWHSFFYPDSMKDFDAVLIPVFPKNAKPMYTSQVEFFLSCVIVKRNGLWGCISSRSKDYSKAVVAIDNTDPDSVKEKLEKISGLDIDFSWMTYEDYFDPLADDSNRHTEEKKKTINVFVGDITKLTVDAIVNAANTSLLGGGGIDGVIHSAAGARLLEECKTLGGCKVGESKITNAYNLPCKKIIHTVGPDCRAISDIKKACELLEKCYISVLDLAMSNHLNSVAFCCISTGIFCFPKPLAAQIAVKAIQNHPYNGDVQICCFTEKDKSFYDKLLIK